MIINEILICFAHFNMSMDVWKNAKQAKNGKGPITNTSKDYDYVSVVGQNGEQVMIAYDIEGYPAPKFTLKSDAIIKLAGKDVGNQLRGLALEDFNGGSRPRG